MSEPNKQPIDPRQIAKSAKVVVQPAPTQSKQIKMPARVEVKQPTPPLPDTHPPKSTLPDTHPAPQSTEVLKKDVIIPQGQKETEKTGDKKPGTFEVGNPGGPGRPKKEHDVDNWLEKEATKVYARQPDGTTLTKAQYLAKQMMDKALEGNVKMMEMVSNRLSGKPMQKIQVVAPEDAEGTVLSAEAEAKLESLFGRK